MTDLGLYQETGRRDVVSRCTKVLSDAVLCRGRKRGVVIQSWKSRLAASVVVVALVGCTSATSRSTDSSVAPVTSAGVSIPLTTVPVPSVTTSSSAVTLTTVRSRQRVVVAELGDIVRPVERTVLYRSTPGNGPGQIAEVEGICCDPVRPWAPVRASDGTVYVADSSNRTWVVIGGSGSPESLYSSGRVIAQPVLDTSDRMFVLMESAGPTGQDLVVIQLPDLDTPIETVASSIPLGAPLEIVGGALVVNGELVAGVSTVTSSDVEVSMSGGSPSRTVMVSNRAAQAEFVFRPDELAYSTVGTSARADDVLIVVTSGSERFAYSLDPIGLTGTGTPIGESAAANARAFADDDGLVQLERIGDSWEIVVYSM